MQSSRKTEAFMAFIQSKEAAAHWAEITGLYVCVAAESETSGHEVEALLTSNVMNASSIVLLAFSWLKGG